MLAFRHTALMFALLFLSSCAYAPGGTGFHWGVCKDDSSQYLQGVDWDQARRLNIRIRQGDFAPTYLGLYMDQPYVLSIENADDGSHSFRAMDFFRAVAVAGVSVDGGDFQEVECLDGVTIPPHTKTALHFVAVRDGTYEFDDNSLMISLAMIGSGGGFITIEPRRTIIESPLKHLNLFDRKPIEITTDRAKLGGSADSAPAPDAPLSGLFDDQENTTPDQPSSLFDSPAPEQPIDPAALQPVESVAVPPVFETPPSEGLFDAPPETPVADQAPEIPVVPGDESEEELFVEEVLAAEPPGETLAIIADLTQPDARGAMPEGFRLLEGPLADVYSDPPDGVRTRPGSGDGGEDRLDSPG